MARHATHAAQPHKFANRVRAMQNLQEGSYSDGGDRLHWEYYDRFSLAHGTTVNDLFVTANGQNNKTMADTNITLGGQMPNSQRFTVRKFAIQYISNTAITAGATIELINKWIDNTVMAFQINNKFDLIELPLSRMFGMSFSTAAAMSAATSTLPTQYGIFNGLYILGHAPVVLAGQTGFKARFTSYTANDASIDGDQVRMSMIGKLDRAI